MPGATPASSIKRRDEIEERRRAAQRAQAITRAAHPSHRQAEEPARAQRSRAVEWLAAAAGALRRGEAVPQRLQLLEVFGGRPREWSMTGATNMLAVKTGAPVVALSLDAGFEPSEDVFDAQLYADMCAVIDAALVEYLWLAIPCESRSIMWTRHGKHPFLSREEPDGRADMPPEWTKYARMHNAIIARGCSLAKRQFAAGRTYFIENPVDVGNRASPYYQHSKRHHVSLWICSWFRTLATETSPSYATTEMCAWLGRFHKSTTVSGAGPRAAAYLYRINEVRCITSAHVLRATDIRPDGTPYSPEAGEYPQLFCAYAAATWLSAWLPEQLMRPKILVRTAPRVTEFLAIFGRPSTQSRPGEPSSAEPLPSLRSGAPQNRAGTRTTATDEGALTQNGEPLSGERQASSKRLDERSLEAWRQHSSEQEALACATAANSRPSSLEVTNWASAHFLLPDRWDESADAVARRVAEARQEPLRFVSRRRAAAEDPQRLAKRHFPCPTVAVNQEPADAYRAAQWPEGCPPRPIAAASVWRDGVYSEMLDAIAAVQHECQEGAAGRHMRKIEPRVFPIELMQPWARKHVEAGGLWDNSDPENVVPMQPYSDADPVPQQPGSANAAFFTEWGEFLRWTDRDMIRQVTVTGIESRSQCSRACIVMGHHGGLRKQFAHAETAIAADTDAGFVKRGRAHPWTFPFIATARNCIERHQWKLSEAGLRRVVKWRVSTDDSISVDGEVSRNDGIDPEQWARAGLPTPQTLAEAVAIAKAVVEEMGFTASHVVLERIALYLLDLVGAYRVLLVQRQEWGQQAYIWVDGIRVDLRCLFGTASMVELFQRVTSFVLAVAKRRIAEFDKQHPYSPARRAWAAWRKQNLLPHPDPVAAARADACADSYIYLDDGFGFVPLGPEEQLRGRVNFACKPVEASVHVEPAAGGGARVTLMLFAGLSRPEVHLRITETSFRQAGWSIAIEKVELGFAIDELGLQCSSLGEGCLAVPEAKRLGMLEDIKRQQPTPRGTLEPGQRIERTEVEQLVGRCGHIAQIAAEANAYMAPMHRMQHAPVTIRSKGRQIRTLPARIDVSNPSATASEYQKALTWWAHALGDGVSVPLAPRLEFPPLDSPGVAFMFTDAARENGSGHGGFTLIIEGVEPVFIYTDPRWPPEVLAALQQNVLSMPAGEGIGAVVFADALADSLVGLRYLIVFTDSTPVVAAIQSGNSDSPQLNAIVRWLFQRRPHLQLLALHQPGKRNGAADGLSRTESASVLKEAAGIGARIERLACERDMHALALSAMQLPQLAYPSAP